MGIVSRVPGLWAGIGLALEAEIVYLAGIRLGSPFLRRLGARTFALSLARVAWGAQSGSQTLILGHSTYDWAPPALFHAFLFWTNRALRRPNAIFSWCAALIAAIVLAAETPAPFIGAAWILLGLALFEIGLRRQLSEFRRQSYCLFAGGVGFASLADWRGLAIGIAALYTAALRSRAMAERFRFALGACLGTAFLAAILLWTTVPPEYFGLALCALAVTVLELGSHNLPTEMRLCFGPLALAATALVIGSNFDGFVKFPTAPVYLSYLGACLAATAAAVRLTWRPPDRAAEWERTALRDAMVFLACAAAMTTVWLTIPDPVVTVLWTAIAVGVLISFPAIAGIAMVPVYARTFDFDLQNGPLTIPVAVAGMYWLWRRFRRVEPWDTLIFWAALLPTLCLIAREAGERNMALGWVVVSIVLLIAWQPRRVTARPISKLFRGIARVRSGIVIRYTSAATRAPWHNDLRHDCHRIICGAVFRTRSARPPHALILFAPGHIAADLTAVRPRLGRTAHSLVGPTRAGAPRLRLWLPRTHPAAAGARPAVRLHPEAVLIRFAQSAGNLSNSFVRGVGFDPAFRIVDLQSLSGAYSAIAIKYYCKLESHNR